MGTEQIEERILKLRNNLKTDRLDMSFGEIMNLYNDDVLIIQPEYQRAYRWSDEQKTKFIESILLGIPIPPIFVAEDTFGKWELVDGLQRVSTILSFFGLLKNDSKGKNNFKLTTSDLIGDILENIDINTFPLKLKLTIQRAVCRVEILRWDSQTDMRYQLFNRLNTGSSPLAQQEIRNCIFTGVFNSLLQELAQHSDFNKLINPTEKQIDEMFLEELVLRFFAFKDNFNDLIIEKNIQDFLSTYMKLMSKQDIDISSYREDFLKAINFLGNECFDFKIFRAKNGLFTPNIYDTVMLMAYKFSENYKQNIMDFKNKIDSLDTDENYKQASGASTYASQRMKKKIEVAEKIFNAR
ncbi:MAG: hypothetical protein RL154_501 [Pseudomonadota bacterium]